MALPMKLDRVMLSVNRNKLVNGQNGVNGAAAYGVGDNLKGQPEAYVPTDSRNEDLQTCRWSKWSEWSQCHDSNSRQRIRVCNKSDGLANNCKCKGFSSEEQSCNHMPTTSQTEHETELQSTYFDGELGKNDTKTMNPSIGLFAGPKFPPYFFSLWDLDNGMITLRNAFPGSMQDRN
ncbi:hypothetical protein KIN20_020326 [Parelaphostrongylus tenuis]|uniref:Uncharacterized protein n=1 Tax=Parelaphostrongylus tenuis TaxID=148309 RepID=A0AAD5QQS9_PARTN|nr:hypothetical protein KIN20_020326 [Parelaphostrongylus tenuis]